MWHGRTIFRRGRNLSIVVVLAIVISASLSQKASASSTGTTCDSVPKYYCAYVDYTNNGSYVTYVNRMWEGALGGSGCPTYCTTKNWQVWWVQDWTWGGSNWTWLRNWGASAWYANCCLGTWHDYYGTDINQPALVNFKFQYQDYYPDTGRYVYWCSPQLDHRLDSGYSYPTGTGTC